MSRGGLRSVSSREGGHKGGSTIDRTTDVHGRENGARREGRRGLLVQEEPDPARHDPQRTVRTSARGRKRQNKGKEKAGLRIEDWGVR
jgi:hypothetical protein